MRQLVGSNVRRFRLAQRLTQEQFTERSGFSQQYISNFEQGRRSRTIVSLHELAQALGVNHLDLLQPIEKVGRAANKRQRSPTTASS
jgi:transcriptional regulator with XRE-family HTH domain